MHHPHEDLDKWQELGPVGFIYGWQLDKSRSFDKVGERVADC